MESKWIIERLYDRIQSANKALHTFDEVMKIEQPSSIERDAAIHRFKISFRVSLKAGKQYLYDIEGLDIGSPKGVIRSFREVGIFSEKETILGLNMINDRNLTVHTSNEELAIKIFGNLPQYYELLRNWVDRMGSKISPD